MNWREYLSIAHQLSIIVAVLAYLQSRRSTRLQHERSRREKAMSTVWEFSRTLNPRSSAARKLARHFSDHQIDLLDQGREFSISSEHKALLCAALPEDISLDAQEQGETIHLTRNQSFLLRWEIISRLNAAEVVAQSWQKDVADRVTIEEELRFLLEPDQNRNILTIFRKIAAAENFPALVALIRELEIQRNSGPSPTRSDESRLFRFFKSMLGRK